MEEQDYEYQSIGAGLYIRVPRTYYVGVKVGGYPELTYVDPSKGDLKLGDKVQVPLGWNDRATDGTVVNLGRRTDYSGPCKSVIGYYKTELVTL